MEQKVKNSINLIKSPVKASPKKWNTQKRDKVERLDHTTGENDT